MGTATDTPDRENMGRPRPWTVAGTVEFAVFRVREEQAIEKG